MDTQTPAPQVDQTQPTPSSTAPMSKSQKKMMFVGGLVVLGVCLIAGWMYNMRYQKQNPMYSDGGPVGTVAQQEEPADPKVAVLTPTQAGSLDMNVETWQSVSRSGFKLKFPQQFFDEADLKASTYYSPDSNNQYQPVTDGIIFNYKYGPLNSTLAERVEIFKREESDSEPDRFSPTSEAFINGVPAFSFESSKEPQKSQYFYFFENSDHSSWSMIHVIQYGPNQSEYTGITTAILNTLTLE